MNHQEIMMPLPDQPAATFMEYLANLAEWETELSVALIVMHANCYECMYSPDRNPTGPQHQNPALNHELWIQRFWRAMTFGWTIALPDGNQLS
jgi:hypothetical protein